MKAYLKVLMVVGFAVASCTSAPTRNAIPVPATAPAAAVSPTEVILPEPTTTNGDFSESSLSGVYEIVTDKSQANYRVTEQLVKNDLPNDAVGTTDAINGSITLLPDEKVDASHSKFTVDLTNLKSDSNMRDNFVRRNVLQIDQFPQVEFVPTDIKGLPVPVPQSGSVTFEVTGDLTIRDVTKSVTWQVTGEINNGLATGKATTHFTFADFNLTQPKVPVVLSVEDNIILEVTIVMRPGGG
jgi:polyisoprenoid-binding protein YceI